MAKVRRLKRLEEANPRFRGLMAGLVLNRQPQSDLLSKALMCHAPGMAVEMAVAFQPANSEPKETWDGFERDKRDRNLIGRIEACENSIRKSMVEKYLT